MSDDALKKVRMLVDWPPDVDNPRWKAGAVREVDAERCARLVADGNAEELLATDRTPEAEARPAAEVETDGETDAPAVTRPRTPRRGRT